MLGYYLGITAAGIAVSLASVIFILYYFFSGKESNMWTWVFTYIASEVTFLVGLILALKEIFL